MIYPVVSVGTKPPLVHVVEALTQEYLFPVTKPLQEHHLTCHKGSPWRHLPSSALGHLDAASTKEFLHQGKGVSTSPAQCVITAPHQAGGSKTITGEPLMPQGFRHTLYNLIHSRITSQGRHTLHSLSSKLKLTLSTRTKHVQSLWMNTWALVWLGYDLQSVLDSSALSHNSAVSNGWVEGV
jgi:hypothetical protein